MRVELDLRSFFSMQFALLILSVAAVCTAAPRSKSKGPQLVFDQKQKGDYNIRVQLKDFQIIALLNEDALGLGDYDYSYDYADFTVKPSGSSTSSKPSEDVSTISTLKPSEISETTSKKYDASNPTLEPVKDEAQNPSSTFKPLAVLGESKPQDQKPLSDDESSIKDKQPSSTGTPSSPVSLIEPQKKPEPLAADSIPGQIQVQVLQTPEGYPNFAVRKDTSVESSGHDSAGKSNEKKCLSGFVKDKRGRCRRLRRPQSALPFDFGRLAHLAARFRSAEKNDASSTIKSSVPSKTN